MSRIVTAKKEIVQNNHSFDSLFILTFNEYYLYIHFGNTTSHIKNQYEHDDVE